MSQNQNTDTTPSTNGAELAVPEVSVSDLWANVREQASKTFEPRTAGLIKATMGGFAPLNGKTAADRVMDAEARMVGGDIGIKMLSGTRDLVAGYLVAKARAEKSVIGKEGRFKSLPEWISHVNAASGDAKAYNLSSMRGYADAYDQSETWAKAYKLEFKAGEGLYQNYGKAAIERLLKHEKQLTKEEFGILLSLVKDGGTLVINGKEEQLPAAAPRQPATIDALFAAVMESAGKAVVMPAEEDKGKREPGGATNQTQDAGDIVREENVGGVTSSATIEKNVSAYDTFVANAKVVQSTLDAAIAAMQKMGNTYASAKLANDGGALTLLEQAFTENVKNQFAANIWANIRRESITQAETRQKMLDSQAIAACIDATKAGSEQPERIMWDGVEIVITDAHRKEAARLLAESSKPKQPAAQPAKK